MKLFKIFIVLTILYGQSALAQKGKISYIKKDTFTKIISINEIGNHGDDFMTINVFNGELDKVQWGSAINITSYRYLGVDSQNNLHIQRNEHNYTLKDEDVCELIFKLDSTKPTEITLIAQRSQKNPLLIKIQVEATNNFIKAKYLGELTVYNE
ncbi:hypothetical protein FNO01nite_34810 [Flavobacterium noncentrifugens]|uniref:DUF4251 domain-containing protein n=1 Tax=Flavobacterium noncentrifugens TaxID=1128970 RepID=A0A1G9DFK2_9FLAO|nr:hypothetical protein [Flavobacterium noncentrifugens]GEP52809.1 hypothetical protein FNO01nite_34810 [Flavobacterium noncentrifugens]SDK62623.1 hypothetical protein SAMN04487935_3804 [Flavobacterium noncentrifugens]